MTSLDTETTGKDWAHGLLGAAWLGIHKRRRAGTTDEGHLLRAAFHEIVDGIRKEYWGGLTKYMIRKGLQVFHDPVMKEVKSHRRQGQPETPLSLWVEYRRLRNGVPMLDRVYAYLVYVEGMSRIEAGDALGLSKWQREWHHLRFMRMVGENVTGGNP